MMKTNKMYSVARRFAMIIKNTNNSHDKPNTHVKRSDIISVLIYEFSGSRNVSVSREFMIELANDIGGTYELNPARIVFTR
jgi:hypothetical protein